MKTKWVLIPVIAFSIGCTRELDRNIKYIDGQFSLFATSDENDTKTVIQQDGSILWSPKDNIKVFYGNTSGKFTSTNTEPAASAEFTGSLGSFSLDGETEFRAVYPYSDATTLSGDNLSIVLPSEQTAVEETFANNLFISVAKSKDVNLHFYNVCGGVCFSLARGDIKKVIFKGNNGEFLAGRLSVGFASNGVPQVTEITSGKVAVTLLAPDDGSFTAGSWYYLVLVPQTLTKGYTMELYTDELVETISSNSSVTVRRSAWGVLKNLGSTSTAIPEAIDLGLSVKWASFNLGASKPEGYGDYYAWGETGPYYSSKDPLIWKEGKELGYNWASYKWCMGEYNTLTKYCNYSEYGYNGFTDTKAVLDPEDDAAFMNLGGSWRMPTHWEWTELRENCTWTWKTQNGVRGYLVTGPNGNSIFLPAAGYRENTLLFYVDSDGFYWSSSLYMDRPRTAWSVFFFADYVYRSDNNRYLGSSVRPVYGDATVISVTGVSLDKTSLSMTVGDTQTLTATITPSNATDKSVTWSSSNTSVATVSSSGVVTAKSAGNATITVTTNDGGKTATCSVTVTKPYTVATPEAVDLGLSVKWASFNLGAEMPEGYGDYFAWGETEPYYINQDPLIWKTGKEAGYDWLSYKWCMGSNTTLTKYSNVSSYGYNGFTDTKTVLDPEDDAAKVNLGGNWRIPTRAEWEELMVSCTLTWTTRNGVNGRLFTASNGNSIFLPAAGNREAFLNGVNSIGYYWSSSLVPAYSYRAWRVSNSSSAFNLNPHDRYYGFSIRPVLGTPIVFVTGVTLDKTSLSMTVGETHTLTATISPSNATDKTVTWSSSNTSIATVSSSGVVTAKAAGSATITVTTNDGGKKATCAVTVTKSTTGFLNGHKFVEMGDGLKWATMNIGASSESDAGDYIAWGETETYYTSISPLSWKEGHSGYGYRFWEYFDSPDDRDVYIIYNNSGGKITLEAKHDAATENWGSTWRMPTKDEWATLLNTESYNWNWDSVQKGYVVTSKVIGYEGNSIFIPTAGYVGSTGVRYYIGEQGWYWSSSLSNKDAYAWYVFTSSSKFELRDSGPRRGGQTIRAVSE